MQAKKLAIARAAGLCLGGVLTLLVGYAQADVVISSAATENMSCSNGTCSPTATRAVLNAGDLESLLSTGSVTVTTTGTGIEARDIKVSATLDLSSSSTLSLEAYRSTSIDGIVSVTGSGGLTFVTNNGGSGGTLSFGAKGSVTFANLSDHLTINGTSFALVDSIATLVQSIDNGNESVALAASYDAGNDGTYSQSPVSEIFSGTFEGLGNTIANLSISDSNDADYVGLFYQLYPTGLVADLRMSNVNFDSPDVLSAGAIVGDNQGAIANSTSSGVVDGGRFGTGGIAGASFGSITNSSSGASVEGSNVGGLVGFNGGTINNSSATGNVEAVSGPNAPIGGGLVGENQGPVETSFATGTVTCSDDYGALGGLIGQMDSGTLKNAYSLGAESGPNGFVGGAVGETSVPLGASYSAGAPGGESRFVGGYVGYDDTSGGTKHAYWDITTSGITDPAQGAGNIANDPGIKGLSTKKLRAKLPKGFSSMIWALDSRINGGLPYLRNNPPAK